MLLSLRPQNILRGASHVSQSSCALNTIYHFPYQLLTSAYHSGSHVRHHNRNQNCRDPCNTCCPSTTVETLQDKLRVLRRPISVWRGPLFSSSQQDEKDKDTENAGDDEGEDAEVKTDKGAGVATGHKKGAPVARHLDRDRSKIIPVETSIRYLKSEAYREAYGTNPVWVLYRRNFPGQFAPKKTRKTCIRQDQITTGNPCPICRDVYLVVDYRNVDLLKQFISPYTGEVLEWGKTGVCRRQHERLIIEIDKAKDYGTITFDVPFREYDYQEYDKIYQSYQ